MSENSSNEEIKMGVSRRGFLKGASLAVAAAGTSALPQSRASSGPQDDVQMLSGNRIPVEVSINGTRRKAEVSPETTLLDLIRRDLDLTGTKKVCDRGSCGACTVIIDGRSACSCSVLALDAHGSKIETVEGLARDGELNSLQKNFVSCDALQCGYCTPGMLMSSTALLRRHSQPSRDQIKAGISGNICRCGTYQNIFEAVEKTAAGEDK